MIDPVPEQTDCAVIHSILGRLGERWSLLLIAELAGGPRRFNDLRRSLDGISQRMLTRTLRLLERDGLVSRTMIAAARPGVEYRLTPLGRTLIEPVQRIAVWAQAHATDLVDARQRFDAVERGDGAC